MNEKFAKDLLDALEGRAREMAGTEIAEGEKVSQLLEDECKRLREALAACEARCAKCEAGEEAAKQALATCQQQLTAQAERAARAEGAMDSERRACAAAEQARAEAMAALATAQANYSAEERSEIIAPGPLVMDIQRPGKKTVRMVVSEQQGTKQ